MAESAYEKNKQLEAEYQKNRQEIAAERGAPEVLPPSEWRSLRLTGGRPRPAVSRYPSQREWDYRHATRGMQGEPLPYGAISWNPRGEPYYGPNALGHIRGMLSRFTAPTPEELPAGYATSLIPQMKPGPGRVAAVYARGIEAAGVALEHAVGGETGGTPAFLGYFTRGVAETLRAALAFLQQPARGVERYVGFTKALAVAGEGSALPYQEISDERLEYLRNIPPTQLAYNAIRYWTSTDRNKADVLARENEAWRIAYSAIYEPLVREEYIRRVQSGEEDPELLAMELEVPGAELVGQIVLDPLNFVGMGTRSVRAAKWLGTAEERFGTYADDMLRGVEDLTRATGRAAEGEATDILRTLAETKISSVATAQARITSRAESRGLFSLLASGKRHVSWTDQGLLSRAVIAAFKGDPDGAVDMFRALIKMASGNVNEVAEGITTSSHFVSPKMLHSQVAEELGITLRTLVTDAEGKVNLNGFLKEWGEAAKTVDGAAAYLTKYVEPALKKIYPTLTDLKKAGVEMGPFYRALETFDRTVGQGPVYKGINTFLSSIYMGMSPGYAIRNYLTNAAHILVDVGPGGLRGAKGAEAFVQNVLDTIPDLAKQTLTAAESETRFKGLPGWATFAMRWSNDLEGKASLGVFAKSLRDNMRKLMTVGRGLPPIEALKNAGFGDDAIKSLLALMEPNGFNPRRAVTAFRNMLADGVIDPVRTGEWLTDKNRRILSDFNMLDEVVKIGEDARAGGRSLEEAQAAIRAAMDDLIKRGDDVLKESGMVARDSETALDAVALDMMRGEIPQAELNTLKDVASANRIANKTHLEAVDEITAAVWRAAQQDPNLTDTARALVQRNAHNANVIDAGANAAQEADAQWLAVWIDRDAGRLRRTVVLPPDTDWAALWNQVGKLGPSPAVITKQTLRDAIFEYYTSTSNARWASAREMIADASRAYLDEARATLPLPLTEVEAKLARARQIIARAEELEAPIAEGVTTAAKAARPVVEGAEAVAKPARVAPVYLEGTMPTSARVIHESRDGLAKLTEELVTELTNTWGNVRQGFSNPAMETALEEWLMRGAGRWEEAKLMASSVAGEMRNFSLLDYPAKRGVDSVLSYVYPYHYWYNRTYAHWLRRLAWNPEVIAGYGKYRAYLEKIHAGSPSWWKYNINTDELLGIDTGHPLFFNLEATLNPLNGLTGIDFNDRIKREQWWAATVDDLSKFGPSVWTPIQVAVAIALKSQGEDEAASRWAGRLIPGTATLKSVTALIGHNAGVEVDPFIHIFSGGIDPYERSRVARALGAMVQDGLIDETQAADAGYYQEGEIWEQARARSANERALGQITSFFAGAGLKGRTEQDLEIDKFWADYNKVWNLEPTLSPEELRGMLDQLRQKYPFMDSMLLARKGGVDRDRSFAYNVLARIPPSQSDDFAMAVGLDSDLLSRFYEEKGHIETWSEADRSRFLGGIMLLGSLLQVPDDATKAEWNEARTRYKQVEADAIELFGEDIWDRVDMYYAAKGEDQASRDRASAILDADPEIDAALQFKSGAVLGDPTLMAYYGSMNMIEGFLKGQMYDQIEKELGPEVWDTWDEYWRMKEAGENYQAFKRQHPELARYGEIKDEWAARITDYMVQLAGKIPERVPASLRPEGDFSSLAAEEVMRLSQQQVSPVANFTPEDWQAQLGGSLYRLSLDAILGDRQLTTAAKQALDDQADAMGIPGGWEALLAFLRLEMQQ